MRKPQAPKPTQNTSDEGELIALEQEGLPKLEVWIEDETIWLSQNQMAILFDVRENTITYHIKEINSCGELEGVPTTRKFRVVRFEGKRQVARQIDFYNLEMIISVGFRVNSRRGVLFRRWANSVIADQIKHGSRRDQRIGKLEQRMTMAERSINTIVQTLIPSLPSNREPIGFHE